MKKQLATIVMVLLGVIMTTGAYAQDYKHPYGLVNQEGKITDSSGAVIGSLSKEGVLKDVSGKSIAHVDANGNMVDTQTGKVIGHAPKNGTFVYYFNGQKETFLIGDPQNGMCAVKDSKGNTVMTIHENYKHAGACAMHCHRMKAGKK